MILITDLPQTVAGQNALQRAMAGQEFLDKKWLAEKKLPWFMYPRFLFRSHTLDVADPCACVIAKATGGFSAGCKALHISDQQAVKFGFNVSKNLATDDIEDEFVLLTMAHRALLRERQQKFFANLKAEFILKVKKMGTAFWLRVAAIPDTPPVKGLRAIFAQ